jgi:hypothetical protein
MDSLWLIKSKNQILDTFQTRLKMQARRQTQPQRAYIDYIYKNTSIYLFFSLKINHYANVRYKEYASFSFLPIYHM